jgi:HK97 gp10 family phage protein
MKLSGGPELLALLDQVPAKIGRNVLRGGVRAAAVVVRDEARATVRRRSGALARTLKVDSDRKGTIVSAKVKARGKRAFIAPFIEYGVAGHVIKPKRKKALTIGDRVLSGPFKHPGHRAFPFMRPALDSKATEAINVMGEYIRQRLSWNTLQAPAIAVEPDEE